MLNKIALYFLFFFIIVFNFISADEIFSISGEKFYGHQNGANPEFRIKRYNLVSDKFYNEGLEFRPPNETEVVFHSKTYYYRPSWKKEGTIYYTDNLQIYREDYDLFSSSYSREYKVVDAETDFNEGITTIKFSEDGEVEFLGEIIQDQVGPTSNINIHGMYSATTTKPYLFTVDNRSPVLYYKPDHTGFKEINILFSSVHDRHTNANGNEVDGSGVKKVTVKKSGVEYRTFTSNFTPTSLSFVIPKNDLNFNTSQNISYIATDNLDNVGDPSTYTLVPDTAIPTLVVDTSNPTYLLNYEGSTEDDGAGFNGKVGYQIKIPFVATDNGTVTNLKSGIRKANSVIPKLVLGSTDYSTKEGKLWCSDITPDGKVKSILNIFSRDVEYTVNSRTYDNVSNESNVLTTKIMLSAQAIIDDLKKVVFTHTSSGKVNMTAFIDLGSLATKELGIDKVELMLIDETSAVPVTLETFTYNITDANTKNDDKRTNGKEVEVNEELDASLFSPHKKYKVKLTTYHKTNGRTFVVKKNKDEVVVDNVNGLKEIDYSPTEYMPVNDDDPLGLDSITLPDNTIISLKENSKITYSNIATNFDDAINDELKDETTSFEALEVKNLQSLIDNSTKALDDTDESLTYELYRPANQNYYYIVLYKTYDDYGYDHDLNLTVKEDHHSYSYLYTGGRIVLDTEVDTSDLSIHVNQDGESVAYVNAGSDPVVSIYSADHPNGISSDVSGINKITYFIYENSSFPMKTDPNDNTKEILDTASIDRAIESAGTVKVSVTGDIKNTGLETEAHGLALNIKEEGTYYIGAKIEDNAGNPGYIGLKEVIVDKTPPDPLSSDNFDYSYDEALKVVTLSLKSDSIDEADILMLDPNDTHVSLDDRNISYNLETDDDGNFNRNESFTFKAWLKDEARNEGISADLTFYTPSEITVNDIDELYTYEIQGIDIIYSIKFDKKDGATGFSSFIVYDKDDNENPLPGNIQSTTTLHQSDLQYNIYSVNDSDFVNKVDGYLANYEPTKVNIIPDLTINNVDSYTTDDGKNYINFDKYIDISTSDIEGDTLTTSATITRGNLTVGGIESNASVPDRFNLKDIFKFEDLNSLQEDTEYTLTVKTVDSWVGGIGAGKSVTTKFYLDKTAPTSSGFHIGKNEGYKIYNGNLKINIEDELVGLKEIVIDIEGSIETYSPYYTSLTNDPDNFTHEIELPEGGLNIKITAIDNLGNLDVVFQDDHIKVDKTKPEITNIELLETDNKVAGKNILSSGFAKFKITWDDQTTPTKLEFEYLDENGKKVNESLPVDVDSFSSIEEKSFEVELFNNYRRITDNHRYNLHAKITDSAGHVSDFKLFNGDIIYDRNGPDIDVINWNFNVVDGINYIKVEDVENPSLEAPVVDVSDTVDSTPSLVYKVLDQTLSGENKFIKVDGVDEFTNIDDIPLDNDGEYFLYIVSKDESNNRSEKSQYFIKDTVAPTDINAVLTDGKKTEAYTGGESLTVSFSGTGVYTYFYDFIDIATQNSIYGVAKELNASEGAYYAITFPRDESIEQQTLRFEVFAKDKAGNTTDIIYPTSESFVLDNSEESITISPSPWVGKNGILNATFNYHPGINNDDSNINFYTYNVHRIRKNDAGVIEDIPLNLDPIVTEAPFGVYSLGEDVKDGDEYYFSVVGTLLSTDVTKEFKSIKIRVDNQNPVIVGNTAAYSSKEGLSVSYTASDNIAVTNVSARVIWSYTNEDDEEVTESTGLITLGSDLSGLFNLSEYIKDETIETGYTAYVDLTVEDIAGNTGYYEGLPITITNSKAPEFTVVDIGDFVNPTENKDIRFYWTYSDDDPECPIVETKYQKTYFGQIDENAWEDVPGNGKEVLVNIFEDFTEESDNGKVVVLAVKKINAAGLERIGYSNGIKLDSTAPIIENGYFKFSIEDEEGIPYFTNQADIKLYIEGYDSESGRSSVSADLGYFEDGVWKDYGKDSLGAFTLGMPIFDISLSDDIKNKRFAYKVIWTNHAGIPSVPFYTRELVYKQRGPEISNIRAEHNNDTISVRWNSRLDVPFKSGVATVKRGNEEVCSESFTENLGYLNFTVDSLTAPDSDDYTVAIKLIDTDEDDEFNSVEGSSNIFIIDRNAPGFNAFTPDYIVSYNLLIQGETDEAISEYAYSVGSASDTPNWKYFDSSGSLIEATINLDIIDNLEDLDTSYFVLMFKVKDSSGNWSDVETAQIEVDLTPASEPVVSLYRSVRVDTYTIELDKNVSFFNDKIDNVLWDSADEESGVVGYRYAVVDSIDEEIEDDDWKGLINVNGYGDYEVTLDYSSSISKEVFIALQAYNGSELYSETGYSDVVLIDLDEPAFRTTMTSKVGDTTMDDGAVIATYNGAGEIAIDITTEESGWIIAKVEVFDPNGSSVDVVFKGKHNLTDGPVPAFTFTPKNELYGNYTVVTTVKDPGENTNESIDIVRYNSPPSKTDLPEKLTLYPLRPLTLDGLSWFADGDGIKSISYLVEHNDEELVNESGLDDKTIRLAHIESTNQLSEYTMFVRVTDNFDAVTTVEVPVNVVNTASGQLYTNEHWSGEHKVTGHVTIPENITLTVADGTKVIFDCRGLYGHGHKLIVNGILTNNGSASYLDDSESNMWGGLVITGDADLSNIEIVGAERGVLFNIDGDSSFNIDGLTVKNCITGLHLYSAGDITITNSNFSNNLNYGIKEEAGVNPTIANSSFTDNGYDYYDTELTAIDFNKLNTLDNNNGNTGE